MYNNSNEQTNGEMFLYNFLQNKCSIIFDVGAYDTVYYLTNDRITYHLFEPLPDVFERLKTKVQSKSNVIANNLALSDKVEKLPFYHHCTSFVKRGTNVPVITHIDLETDTIDNYMDRNGVDFVDFLKIDTEGWELSVIKGAEKHFDHIYHIQFEYGGTWKDGDFHLKEMMDILIPAGFIPFIIFPNGLKPVSDFTDHYNYCNYFMTRKIDDIKDIIK